MKLTNRRIGWSVAGDFVCLLPMGIAPTDDEILAYFHLKPGDARFADHARAAQYVRCVLRKPNGNYVITPLSPDIAEVTT